MMTAIAAFVGFQWASVVGTRTNGRHPIESAALAVIAVLAGMVLVFDATPWLLSPLLLAFWIAVRREALVAALVGSVLAATVGIGTWVILVARTPLIEPAAVSVALVAGLVAGVGWMAADMRRTTNERLGRVQPGVIVAGRYAVRRAIGNGSSGTVYLAIDRKRKRKVALKQASRESLESGVFDFNGPGVVPVLDHFETASGPLVVLQYMPGGVVAFGDDSRAVMREALEALAAIHDAGFVHRDIKPDNLLKDAEGCVRIADLGLAVPMDADVTQVAGSAIGTVAYMSPEQARGQKVGVAGDLYSLAAVGFELLTGRRPVAARPGESAVELQLRIAGNPSIKVDDLTNEWRGFFEIALAPIAAKRFPDARAMLAALP